MKLGFQTYTWQMSFEKYAGDVRHIARTAKEAGFACIESEICMLGDAYFYNPDALLHLMDEEEVELGAVCLVCDWLFPQENEVELGLAQQTFTLLERFPKTKLVLCQAPQADRSELETRQRNAVRCINAVARRAAQRGIDCSFHPNSPPGSAFRTAEDYAFLWNHLDFDALGFCPDSGHIARGGMNVVDTFAQWMPHIRHVHFKDMDQKGKWCAMGEGAIPFPKIVRMLEDHQYDGYIMVEEESDAAVSDPDGVTKKNGQYLMHHFGQHI